MPDKQRDEYRLVVDKGYTVQPYPKRDLDHATEGMKDTFEHSERLGLGWNAYVERRSVTDWQHVEEGTSMPLHLPSSHDPPGAGRATQTRRRAIR